jgi:hypothetical protein
VRLWNVATTREMIKMNVVHMVRFLGFSPGGETLAVGEANDTIRLLRAPPLSQIEATAPPPALGEDSSAPEK